MSTKKNKSAKKGSAKKSANSSKGKNKSRTSGKKKPQKSKGAKPAVAPEPTAPAVLTGSASASAGVSVPAAVPETVAPVTPATIAPVVIGERPHPPVIPIPQAPSQLPTSTLAPSSSPIGASSLEVKAQEKKPRVIRITEPPMPTPQVDKLANQPPAPFQSRPSFGTPAPAAQASDLKTLSGTVKKICVNHKHFRPLSQSGLQDIVNKTHSDVTVTYNATSRHVKLTQGAATEEFNY